MSGHRPNTIVIALGGSIIVPRNVQVAYIKRLQNFLVQQIGLEKKIVLVVGGGALARVYQQAAEKISGVSDEDKDWIGVHATHLNAHFLRMVLAEHSYPGILTNPEKLPTESDLERYSIFVGAGWQPGSSTDYVAFRLAQALGVATVLIATKIRYVYDKDVSVHKDAHPFRELTWKDYRKLIGDTWYPGMKAPVDPVAAQFAQQNNMSAVVLRGTNISNMRRYMNGGTFEGTTIRP